MLFLVKTTLKARLWYFAATDASRPTLKELSMLPSSPTWMATSPRRFPPTSRPAAPRGAWAARSAPHTLSHLIQISTSRDPALDIHC